MKITITLTPEETAGLKALAIVKKCEPKDIIQQFASEVTGSLRSRGSDERLYAEEWLNRTFFRFDKMTDAEQEKYDRLTNEAYHHREDEREQWRREQAAKKGGAS
jgi:hypothetical protein